MENTKLEQLIKEAKVGNKNAISELYENGKDSIYFTCLKLLNNSEDALDITQDTFLTVFEKINTLEDYNSYSSWQKTIAINKCKNYLIKNKPVLFTDNKIENLIVLNIEDMDSEFIPHDYIDNLEKRNIIMDILDAKLSDVQRISTILFYYEEKSIKDISSILECSEGTVKSRLSSSRRIIKSEIEKIENKGIKLHSIAGIPVLSLILQETAKNTIIPQEISIKIFNDIVNNLESIGVISTSVIGGIHSGFTGKIIRLIKGSTLAKVTTIVVMVGIISTTVVLSFVMDGNKGKDVNYVVTEDSRIQEDIETETKKEEIKTDKVAEDPKSDLSTETEVEVAPKAAETPNTNSNTVEVTKQQQEEYVAPKPAEVATPKPAAVATPKPAETPKPVVKTPSVSSGYNADMTSKLMRMYTTANTNNSDVYSQHSICTPGFLSQFKSIAGQYCSGAISDPSAIKNVRGDYNVTDTRVFYTVIYNFSYGEVTGNDADSLYNSIRSIGARKGGCISISCSYNGSTYVARFVYAKTEATED